MPVTFLSADDCEVWLALGSSGRSLLGVPDYRVQLEDGNAAFDVALAHMLGGQGGPARSSEAEQRFAWLQEKMHARFTAARYLRHRKLLRSPT
jgi:hypothetical protein